MKRLVGVCSILLAIIGCVVTLNVREELHKDNSTPKPMRVVVHKVQAQSVDDAVIGHGQISARWQTTLSSEVTGRVIDVSENLLVGETFQKGDVLVTLAAAPYEAALARAEAALETSKRALEEELQRVRIAEDNWTNSGFEGTPSDLVLRKPQLREARANVTSSAAAVRKAEYDLAQTKVTAPYDGVVLERNVNPGGVLQNGMQIARIYDGTIFEVRIPLSVRESERLKRLIIDAPVMVESSSDKRKWRGRVARVEQSIDTKNRWKNVVVEIQNTEGLFPGMFVAAHLPGKNHKHAIILPEHFLGEGGNVWIVDKQSRLQRFPANVLFRNDGKIIISSPMDPSVETHVTPARDIYLPGVHVVPLFAKNEEEE